LWCITKSQLCQKIILCVMIKKKKGQSLMCFVRNPFRVHILPPSTWQDDAAVPEACVVFSRL